VFAFDKFSCNKINLKLTFAVCKFLFERHLHYTKNKYNFLITFGGGEQGRILAPQILVRFSFKGPPKKLLRKKNADQKKRSLNNKYKGKSED
jgi:hypothetical protein